MMTSLALLAAAAALHVPALHRAPRHRAPALHMCSSPAGGADFDDSITLPPLDVSLAAEEIIGEMVSEEMGQAAMSKQAGLDFLWSAPPTIDFGDDAEESSDDLAYIAERVGLVGEIDSSELLLRDEAAGQWPIGNLPHGDRETSEDMLWVDELSCIGCRWCADVARSTFQMAEPYGTAKVMQQGGDPPEVVEEAIDCCPANCIHPCSRAELELLEEHRSLGHIEDLQARYQFGSRLSGQGDVPYWKDPITHQGWRKGDKYVRAKRLKLSDPLLHKSGEPTGMSLIGHKKVNEAPSPTGQDGTVIPEAPTEEVE